MNEILKKHFVLLFMIKLKNLKSKEDLKGELRKVLSNPLPIQPNTI